jgi:hypothetical protein
MRRTVELFRHHVPRLQQPADGLKKIIADALSMWHTIKRRAPTHDRQTKDKKAREFFDGIWREGATSGNLKPPISSGGSTLIS